MVSVYAELPDLSGLVNLIVLNCYRNKLAGKKRILTIAIWLIILNIYGTMAKLFLGKMPRFMLCLTYYTMEVVFLKE